MSDDERQVIIPPKLIPVFQGKADVRGSHGGRGSAKTRTFAKMTAIRAYMWDQAGRDGIILCGRQFMNSLEDSSLEEVKSAIRSEPWLEQHFDIGEKFIRTKSGRVSYSFAGLDRNVESIKSKYKILLCWVDEAELVIEHAWSVLIPTLREEDSELWVTWNPANKAAATNKRFYKSTVANTNIVEMNWRDNPFFPDILNRTRLKDQEERPDSYEHVWEGQFLSVVEGAYFAKALTLAKNQGRIGFVGPDPLMTTLAFFDIGGTGRKSDATAIWIAQFIGAEVRVLDYYEAVGQPLETHVAWMRRNGAGPDITTVWLPHDGANHEKTVSVTYQSALEDAGYEVEVMKNQGRGAALNRIDAARRLFPSIRFNEDTTEAGRTALGWYHEKIDEKRQIGLGPEHDWASHCADAFGLMAVVHETEGPMMDKDLPQTEWEMHAHG